MMGNAEWRYHVKGRGNAVVVLKYAAAGLRHPAVGRSHRTAGRCGPGTRDGRERGSGTVLAAGLALVVMTAMAVMLLLAQSAVLASRAAAAADLAALAAADALRGITTGEPCSVAAEVAARHAATVLNCSEGVGQTVEVRTELVDCSLLGAATGRARAGPPP
ncbi:Rv3654c family TadE-like protein [Arthrobacter sp. SLBN-122]|uniref:Rv3654c family TadE-like protein n=1 Tax=Arthrobacter sp. SLBN-122 TaxID=2768455 RepID=UPI001172DF62|nr:secretion/DNA translocation related TadE-like protein [Arthrobacter sp. SLBN-122]